MRLKFKGWLVPVLGCVAGYILVLALLTAVESADPDASIQTFADALWYSIVTLSTVGYGDLYPVTPVGKILGIVFVLLSVGLLSFIVGAAISLITGRMFPALQLRLLRSRRWFVFSQMNEGSVALAEDLSNQYPDAVCLFPKADQGRVAGAPKCCYYPDTLDQAVAGKKSECSLFFMDEKTGVNYEQALAALPLGCPVYCRTEQAPDRCPENLTLFNRYDCCAQEYWHNEPLGRDEITVLLIGSGKYARRVLERGLLTNVFGDDHRVSYHVFGNWQLFRRNHPELGATVGINEAAANRDCLFFHDAPWNEDPALLYQAERIILCEDEELENLEVLMRLRRYFPTKGKIHLRASAAIPGEMVFGTVRKTYTAELVLSNQLTGAARLMHQIYRDSTGGEAPAWEALSEFVRQSNIAAADHLLTKIRILLQDDSIRTLSRENCAAAYQRYCDTRAERVEEYRRIEHLRWMRFHSMYNWRYSPRRDNAARLHPLMRPYEELTLRDQEKDDYAWELLNSLAKVL